MEGKHTPGPWRCTTSYVIRAEKDDSAIAFPRLQEPKELGSEEKASLQLCAAAPDLWEACVAAAELLASGQDMFDADGRPLQTTNDLFEKLKAAIFKAEKAP